MSQRKPKTAANGGIADASGFPMLFEVGEVLRGQVGQFGRALEVDGHFANRTPIELPRSRVQRSRDDWPVNGFKEFQQGHWSPPFWLSCHGVPRFAP